MTPHPSFRGLGDTQRSTLVELDLCGDKWLTIKELQRHLRQVRQMDITAQHLRSVVRSLEKRELVEVRQYLNTEIEIRCTNLGHAAGWNGDPDVFDPPWRR